MVKQIIVMRKDLNMRKGKMVAQGGHSVVGVIEGQGAFTKDLNNINWNHKDCTSEDNYLVIPLSPAAKEWFTKGSGFAKICVYVNSEAELLEIYANAKKAKLPVELITDSGRTEFNGVPTKTCLAIGPADCDEIDKITGHLPLL